MRPNRIILFVGSALSLTLSALPSSAQIISTRIGTTTDAATIDALTKRIETLESMVAQLQQQTAFIKSVNPLVLDASGAAVTVRGGQMLLEAGTGLDIRAGGNATIRGSSAVSVDAGTGLDIRAGGNATIRGSSAVSVDATAGLDLKGAFVKLNNGDRPVACAGAIVNGTTATGASGRLDHSHSMAVPLPACGSTVLVPSQE
jgi:hypothetical protein